MRYEVKGMYIRYEVTTLKVSGSVGEEGKLAC